MADPGGVVTGMITPPPLELVPILKTYCKVFVTGTDHPPPPLAMWMTSHRQCPRGWWCLGMSKSGGVFHFFGGRMTSRGQCPRGWWCLGMSKSGGVFQFSRGRMMSRRQCPRSKGVCVLVECLHPPPPPSGGILYPRLLSV